jgi:hypothetical protein
MLFAKLYGQLFGFVSLVYYDPFFFTLFNVHINVEDREIDILSSFFLFIVNLVAEEQIGMRQ